MSTYVPLAEKLRPSSLEEVVGQEHLLGEEGVIRRSIAKGQPLSVLLWGPPGCGKTSIARLYARAFSLCFVPISAIYSGVSEIKRIVQEAKEQPLTRTLVFVDEIHRFHRGQQEAFLPHVEDGTFVLVGATAENPSFHLSHALLSRMQVLSLNALTSIHLEALLEKFERVWGTLPMEEAARHYLIECAQGDGRYLFNLLESLGDLSGEGELSLGDVQKRLQRRASLGDRMGDTHHKLISALHKAVRGSDPQATLYWFARMLEAGCEPLYLARRMIRMASEDIGLADPNALTQCIAARDAFQTLGSPEGELALAQAAVYLATAPKSNAIYLAMGEVADLARKTTHVMPPKHILNACTRLLKEEGYGEGYAYDHDYPHAFSGQKFFPEGMGEQEFYRPVERGFEREVKRRMDYFSALRRHIAESRRVGAKESKEENAPAGGKQDAQEQ